MSRPVRPPSPISRSAGSPRRAAKFASGFTIRARRRRRRRSCFCMAAASSSAISMSMTALRGNLRSDPACASSASITRWRPSIRFPVPLNDCIAAIRWAATQGARLGHRSDAHCGRRRFRRRQSRARLDAGAARCRQFAGAGHGLHLWLLCARSEHRSPKRPMAAAPISSARRKWPGTGIIICPTRPIARNPLAAPLFADLRGLPPLHITAAEFDPLRNDSERLVEKAESGRGELRISALARHRSCLRQPDGLDRRHGAARRRCLRLPEASDRRKAEPIRTFARWAARFGQGRHGHHKQEFAHRTLGLGGSPCGEGPPCEARRKISRPMC